MSIAASTCAGIIDRRYWSIASLYQHCAMYDSQELDAVNNNGLDLQCSQLGRLYFSVDQARCW